ncbi:MAG TPA: hypothetical protein VM238_18575 [Phycisphaerae bacterium]|nr:hypothetical protein [Phycisphaerae bacterium]
MSNGGPTFTRRELRLRHQHELECGQTTMNLESWLLDEVNALESLLGAYQQLATVVADTLKAERRQGMVSIRLTEALVATDEVFRRVPESPLDSGAGEEKP